MTEITEVLVNKNAVKITINGVKEYPVIVYINPDQLGIHFHLLCNDYTMNVQKSCANGFDVKLTK